MEKFFSFSVKVASVLAASGQLKEATLYMVKAAARAQSHQISYAKFSRILTHCNFGTSEHGTRAYGYRRLKFARLPHDSVAGTSSGQFEKSYIAKAAMYVQNSSVKH